MKDQGSPSTLNNMISESNGIITKERSPISIRILSLLLAIDTYLFIGPQIASFSNSIDAFFANSGFIKAGGWLALLFVLPIFFIYRYAYTKQMEFIGSDKFPIYLEQQRRKFLNESVFLFTTKEAVSKKWATIDAFAKSLIPVAILIFFIFYFFPPGGINSFPTNFRTVSFWNFYLGLVAVLYTFNPYKKG